MKRLSSKQISKIDRYIRREMGLQAIPGLTLGIFNRGEPIYLKGYGVGNIKTRAKVKPETIFCIASIGKQFVSMAVMMLVEEGRMGLNDTLLKYFPRAPKNWGRIKIKHMLSHTSGLGEYENDPGLADDEFNGPKSLFYSQRNYSENELSERAQKLAIAFKPGEKWAYCNTNYMLLGIILHKVTGKFWFDYLKERIFDPLGMTSVRHVFKKDVTSGISLGYELRNGRLREAVWWSDTFNSQADGVFYCNTFDLAKWDKALYSTRLIKQSSLNRIWTVFKLNNKKPNPGDYGFGWEIHKIDGHKVIEHSGGMQGFTSNIARYVDSGITVVVMNNLHDSAATRMSHEIAKIII